MAKATANGGNAGQLKGKNREESTGGDATARAMVTRNGGPASAVASATGGRGAGNQFRDGGKADAQASATQSGTRGEVSAHADATIFDRNQEFAKAKAIANGKEDGGRAGALASDAAEGRFVKKASIKADAPARSLAIDRGAEVLALGMLQARAAEDTAATAEFVIDLPEAYSTRELQLAMFFDPRTALGTPVGFGFHVHRVGDDHDLGPASALWWSINDQVTDLGSFGELVTAGELAIVLDLTAIASASDPGPTYSREFLLLAAPAVPEPGTLLLIGSTIPVLLLVAFKRTGQSGAADFPRRGRSGASIV